MNNTEDIFEQQLSQQILLSEKKRVFILAILLTFLTIHIFVSNSIIPSLFPEEFFHKIFYNLPFWIWFSLFFLVSTLYEWSWFLFLGYAIKNKRHVIVGLRYLNVFVETSLPTMAIFLLSQTMEPTFALVSPAGFMYFFFIFLAALRLDFKLCLFTGIVAAVEYSCLAWWFLSPLPESQLTALTTAMHHIIKTMLLFLAGLVTGLITLQLKTQMIKSFQMVQELNNIAHIFGQYVSTAVVEKLLHQPKELTNEMRYVCVMFLDIRDFTQFSENNPPDVTIHFLNTVFEPMIEIVNQHQGIINKFLGDGFMAIFGAPFSDGKESQHAVQAALAILETADKLAQREIPPTRIGIGLHTGYAITGNVGSMQRKEYTVIGDVVNLASRIEQLNKPFKSQLLISEEVFIAIGENISTAIDKGKIQVKGRKEAVRVYQIV